MAHSAKLDPNKEPEIPARELEEDQDRNFIGQVLYDLSVLLSDTNEEYHENHGRRE